jgi:hypothetical protein
MKLFIVLLPPASLFLPSSFSKLAPAPFMFFRMVQDQFLYPYKTTGKMTTVNELKKRFSSIVSFLHGPYNDHNIMITLINNTVSTSLKCCNTRKDRYIMHIKKVKNLSYIFTLSLA